MESGSTAELIGDRPVFIAKVPREDMLSLDACDELSMEIEVVPREEFPTARIHFELRDRGGARRAIEYFFALDSPYEKEILTAIGRRGDFYLLLLDAGGSAHLKRVEFTLKERERISSALGEWEEALREP